MPVVETSAKSAKFPHPIGKGTVEFVTAKLMPHKITVAEVRGKSNAIQLENIAKK